MEKLSVTFDGARELTGLSYVTLRRLVKDGSIRAARVGRRVLIPIAELKKLTAPGSKRRAGQ